jgi:hypothetical protein
VRIGLGVALLIWPGLGLAPTALHAEMQRVEAVGSFGIPAKRSGRVIPRDRAIQNGLWEAVSRVALEVIGEAPAAQGGEEEPLRLEIDPDTGEPVTSEDELAVLRDALGKDMLPYARSFRIVDDQGESPVLFEERPGIKTEYVVVVEVLVDARRVSEALQRAGLIAALAAGEAGEVRLELMGLTRYEALEAVLEALREGLGATRVDVLEFARERQVLAVEGAFGPRELSSWASRFESPNLVLEPVELDEDGRGLRVLARWFPDPEMPAEEASRGRPSVSSGPSDRSRSTRLQLPAGRSWAGD